MSQTEKADYRVFGKTPIPTDITPKELEAALVRYNFKLKPGKGSHLKVSVEFKDGTMWCYTIPVGGRKTVLPVYVRKIRETMKEHASEVHFA